MKVQTTWIPLGDGADDDDESPFIYDSIQKREGTPEYSRKMLGSSIQGILAEYSVGSEHECFFKKLTEIVFTKKCIKNP